MALTGFVKQLVIGGEGGGIEEALVRVESFVAGCLGEKGCVLQFCNMLRQLAPYRYFGKCGSFVLKKMQNLLIFIKADKNTVLRCF